MPRKVYVEKVPITVRVDREVVEDLREFLASSARPRGMTMGDAVEEALREFLRRWKEVEE